MPNNKTNKLSNVVPKNDRVKLNGFSSQVGGRAGIYKFDEQTLCKPFVSRELYFYLNIPCCLQKFIPKFKGLVTVELFHTSNEVEAYALKSTVTKNIKSLDVPSLHSKRCIGKMDGQQTDFSKTNLFCEDQKDKVEELENKLSDVTLDEKQINCTDRQPWSNKVLFDTYCSNLSKSSGDANVPRTKQYMLMENLAHKYKRPNVLDVKVGTCIRYKEKLDKLSKSSTRINIGLRLSGMQLYNSGDKCYSHYNKYDGDKMNSHQFASAVKKYFQIDDGERRKALVSKTIETLQQIQHSFESLLNRRFYSCSILLLREGSCLDDRIEVKIIDFAHYCLEDCRIHPGADTGILFGIRNLVKILKRL